MNPLKTITTVYSYYLPEIRDVITRMTREYPHDVFLRSVSPGLDDFHVPIMEKLVGFHARDVAALAGFGLRYPTSGSEEGIREYMTALQAKGVKQVYMWRGDYEGYRDVAATRNMKTVELDYDSRPDAVPPGYWFLSNPSARNGMIVPVDRINAIAEAGHRIFYDLSYLGTTAPTAYDVSHPNIEAVAISFSKPYGLFYYRIGFLFCREAVTSLFANKWFKNVYGLILADRVLGEIDQDRLAAKYKGIQAEIVAAINGDTGLGLSASDVFLLANMPAEKAALLSGELAERIARHRRGNGYRFCLTPYFEEYERSRRS